LPAGQYQPGRKTFASRPQGTPKASFMWFVPTSKFVVGFATHHLDGRHWTFLAFFNNLLPKPRFSGHLAKDTFFVGCILAREIQVWAHSLVAMWMEGLPYKIFRAIWEGLRWKIWEKLDSFVLNQLWRQHDFLWKSKQ
jgi:hypothetical protein